MPKPVNPEILERMKEVLRNRLDTGVVKFDLDLRPLDVSTMSKEDMETYIANRKEMLAGVSCDFVIPPVPRGMAAASAAAYLAWIEERVAAGNEHLRKTGQSPPENS